MFLILNSTFEHTAVLILLALFSAQLIEGRFCDQHTECPFRDLSAKEVNLAIKVIKASLKFSDDLQFPIVRTQEPSKSKWNSKSGTFVRLAYVAVFDSESNLLSEVVVDLVQRSIVSTNPRPTQLPPLTEREIRDARALFMGNPNVKDAYVQRGLNLSHAACATLVLGAIGLYGHPPGSRLLRLIAFYQPPGVPYFEWQPVEGLEVIVDLSSNTVHTFIDQGQIPAPPGVHLTRVSKPKPKLKPLRIEQPKGSSIKVRGQHISWHKWKLLYSMDPIHGLQLFHVRYHADGEERLILHKASISEMFVPYGDPAKNWRWRNPFDAGEYGLGRSSSPLVVGVDLPENAILFNCTIADDDGKKTKAREACIGAYERDAGILYKHRAFDTGKSNGLRAREMVLTFTASIGNYDYAFEYVFKMGGALDVNVRLTGIVLPRGVTSARNDATCLESCANLVSTNLIAPVHQHFFNYRLDFDIDGPLNSVMEVNVVQNAESSTSDDIEAFSVRKKLLTHECWRDWNYKSSRHWMVVNANSRNKFGSMRGYALKPSALAHSFLNPRGPLYAQAQFATHPFWATVHKDSEQSAAGSFPRSGKPGQGLPNYVHDGQSLDNSDVVVWFTVGVTHVTRPEDWPIMNANDAGLRLVPVNFMSSNQEVPY